MRTELSRAEVVWLPAAPTAPAAAKAGSRLSFVLLLAGAVFIYLDALVPISRYNFHISDILFAMSLAAVLIAPASRRRFVSTTWRQPLVWAFAALALVWLIGLAIGAGAGLQSGSPWILGVLQLGYVFFVLAPLLFFHAQFPPRHRALWLSQCVMLAFAGLLSLTEFAGITHLIVQSYFRIVNPLRGLNGLYFFGLVSAYLLQFAIEEFPRPSTWAYVSLWALGFLGVGLGAIRLGIVLTILSLAAVVWQRRQQLRRHPRAVFGLAVLLACTTLGGGYLALRISPGLRDRIENGNNSAGIWYIADRVVVARIAWQEILRRPEWFGEGVGQFMIQHPEIGITVHDAPLQQLFEVGYVGLAVWVWIWWLMWLTPYRQYRRARADRQRRAMLHWWCCQFAIICFLLADISSPTGLSRSEWIVPLLAVGTWRLWSPGALDAVRRPPARAVALPLAPSPWKAKGVRDVRS